MDYSVSADFAYSCTDAEGEMGSDKAISIRIPRVRSDSVHVRSTPLRILSVGRDPAILQLREQVICSRSDLSVRSLTPEEADTWTQRPNPHLWIFCHTLETRTLVYLACRVLRFSPESRLLLLHGGQRIGFEASLFHKVIRPVSGEEVFLDTLAAMATAG